MNEELPELNLDERCAAPDKDAVLVRRIEINFDLPSYLSQQHIRKLYELVGAIVDEPANEPKEGLHWLSFTGSKLNFSRADAMLLGGAVGEDPPADGEEPEVVPDVVCFNTAVRSWSTAQERERTLAARAGRAHTEFTCPKCGGHSFGSSGKNAQGKWDRYCNGRGQRGRVVGDRFIPHEGPDEPIVRCDFTWNEDDDQMYGLRAPSP